MKFLYRVIDFLGRLYGRVSNYFTRQTTTELAQKVAKGTATPTEVERFARLFAGGAAQPDKALSAFDDATARLTVILRRKPTYSEVLANVRLHAYHTTRSREPETFMVKGVPMTFPGRKDVIHPDCRTTQPDGWSKK